MSITYKKNVFASIIGLLLVLLALGMWSSACTLGECASGEREMCVGEKCECGVACVSDDNCIIENEAKTDYLHRCMAYEFTPEHGVCVSKAYLKIHRNETPENLYGRHLVIPGEPPEEL